MGLLYSAFTYYTGFRVNSGEYKLMGLAPYGRPLFENLIREHLLDLKEDGSFRLDMSYFNYCQGLTMTSPEFHKLFGGEPRQAESRVTQREMDLAASDPGRYRRYHAALARHVHDRTGSKNLVLAGGVALNCVGNGRILREGPFENVWIQPAAGDAGGALGAALFIWYQLLDKPRHPQKYDQQKGSFLGPSYSDDQIAEFLDRVGAVYTTCGSDDELCDEVSSIVAEEKVVGWFQGRMEFGPRARGTEHHRRRAQREDAVGHEPEDQVPRVVSALCPLRLARGSGQVLRNATLGRQSVHAAGRSGTKGAAQRNERRL